MLQAPRIMKLVDILLSRKEKPQEAHAPVLAGLVKRKEHQVVPQPSLAHHTVGDGPVACERLDRMLGIVVIPRDAIMPQEGEEFLTIPDEPPPVIVRNFRRKRPAFQGSVEAINIRLVFMQ